MAYVGEPVSRAYSCLNCQRTMKLDSSLKRGYGTEKKSAISTSDQDSRVGEPKNLLKIISDSNVLSETPVCRECANQLKVELDMQYKTLTEECSAYENLIKEMEDFYGSSSVFEKKKCLENLKKDENRLKTDLQQLLDEEKDLEHKLTQEKAKLEEEVKKEEEGWRLFRDNHNALIDINSSIARIDAELKYADTQHKKLSGLNILNACFNIWVDNDGTIGEINGFRLGRLPDQPVDWPEINAAWGQLAFLLDVLLDKAGVKLENKKIVPLGSYSYITVTRPGVPPQSCFLYGSGPVNPFGNQYLDSGISAFLQCFETLYEAVKAQNPKFTLQFNFHGDKFIHDKMEYSAKTMLNSEERWTKAMKMLLSNLKVVMLAIISLKKPS